MKAVIQNGYLKKQNRVVHMNVDDLSYWQGMTGLPEPA